MTFIPASLAIVRILWIHQVLILIFKYIYIHLSFSSYDENVIYKKRLRTVSLKEQVSAIILPSRIDITILYCYFNY